MIERLAALALLGLLLSAEDLLAQTDANASLHRIVKDCPLCPPMIEVPSGRFVMGSDDGEAGRPEGPRRELEISRPFLLGRFEVTNAEFRAFIDATGYAVTLGCRTQLGARAEDDRVGFGQVDERSWLNPGFATERRDDHPVVCVSHADARAYVAWLAELTGQAYRLPSEAEWEYAARAGSEGIYPWGNNIDLACRHANVFDRAGHQLNDFGWGYADCDDGYAELAPAGSFIANSFGLHDMIGNVWEWTADCYQLTYDGAPSDGSAVLPTGECARWSVRGGGWMTRPSRQRLTFRGRDPVDARYSYFGFRVARNRTPDESRP